MIVLTKLDNDVFYINANMIETIEETPNTVITLNSGKKFIVKESANVILEKMVQFYQRIYNQLPQKITDNNKG